MKILLQDIAALIQAEIEGETNIEISGIAKIEEGKNGDISFLSNLKYENFLYDSESSAVIVSHDFQPKEPLNLSLVRVKDPYVALSTLMQAYEKLNPSQFSSLKAFVEKEDNTSIAENAEISSFAYISSGCKLGNDVKVSPGCFIGKNVTIGENSLILPNVTILKDSIIGKNCIIHPNVVIGSEGFGFAPKADGSFEPIPQLGNVIIGDHVRIGSGTTIDRATMGSTKIGNGVKLDNLIQIAHNVEIDDHTVIAAQTGIAGSTKIGKHCIIGGQVGFAGHIKIADYTKIGSQASVTKSITKSHQSLTGRPLLPVNAYLRLLSKLKNL